MNEVILSKNNLVMKRLWNLDTNTYEDGAIDKKTKEMLGLVASMVLRCDDCIKYHLGKSFELGVTTEQMYEIFAVANIVGGTIVIPHTRRASARADFPPQRAPSRVRASPAVRGSQSRRRCVAASCGG